MRQFILFKGEDKLVFKKNLLRGIVTTRLK